MSESTTDEQSQKESDVTSLIQEFGARTTAILGQSVSMLSHHTG